MLLLWDAKLGEELDEGPRSLLKRLLDEATQQAIQSHAEAISSVASTLPAQNPKEAPKLSPSPPPAAEVTPMEPPFSVESGGCHPLIFLAKPRNPGTERRTKQKRSDHIRHPHSRGRRNRRTGMLPPPQRSGSPLRKAGDSRRATSPDSESSPIRVLTRPRAATSWAIVPAGPAQAAVRPKRSRLEAVDLPTKTHDLQTPTGSRWRNESTRVGQRMDRVKTELGPTTCTWREEKRTNDDAVVPRPHGRSRRGRGLRNVRDRRTRKMGSPDQTAEVIKQKKPPDRGFTARIARLSSAEDCPACTRSRSRRVHRKEIQGAQGNPPDLTVGFPRLKNPGAHRVASTRRNRPRQRERSPLRPPSGRTRSQTSCRTCSCTTSSRPPSGSSSSCLSSTRKALPRKARRGTASRQDPVERPALFKQRSARRETIPTGYHPSSSRQVIPLLSGGVRPPPELVNSRKKQPPARRPVVVPPRSKATESTAVPKADHRDKKAEKKKDGRLRRLKNRLGHIFHHHHHHYHHHHPSSDAENGGGAYPERRRHRSLGELLRGIFRHTGWERAGGEVRRPPRQEQRHGYLHTLLEGLLWHVWRGPKRRKRRQPQAGGAAGRVAAKKLHWWQKLRRRRRGMRVGSRRRRRLRLGFGRKASVERGGSKKNK